MAKLVKLILVIVAAIVGIGAIGAVALMLFFDPNDYRDTISAQVEQATGRDFSIDGDLSVSVFPWVAVEVGSVALGNGEGFGEAPMIRFDSARLSVKVLPLILQQQVRVGTAVLEGFEANLAVAADGRSNWGELMDTLAASDPAEAPTDDDGSSADFSLDIDNVVLSDAQINYDDAQGGAQYELSNVNFNTGRIALDNAFDIDGSFDFSAAPADISGDLGMAASVLLTDAMSKIRIDNLQVRSNVNGIVSQPAAIRFDARSIAVDTESEEIQPGELDLSLLGLQASADIQPIRYANAPEVTARLRVSEFSLKELMAALDIEAPVTADADALEKLSFEATANVGETAMALSDLSLIMDDTTLTGDLSVPLDENGSLTFDLRADSININNYMAPPSDEEEVSEDGADVEIPVDLIRTLKARGTVSMAEAFVGPARFTDMKLGVNGAEGKLRLNPISASFFNGGYAGDVRIDASGATPTLSVNEKISGVDVAAMMAAMYDVTDITGTVSAGFELSGAGETMSAITSDLDGTMNFELLDGAWQGVDVWHQIRSARALFKREQAPEQRQPVRTEFSNVTASGPVTDGVFKNDNLTAELPFLRVTGGGTVDLAEQEIDYSVQARILEKPEFMSDMSEDELADFTQATIPIRIRGSLSSPSFRPDIEGVFRQEVDRAIDEKKDELKQKLLDRIRGNDEPEQGAGEGADAEEAEEEDLEDQLKKSLKSLIRQ